MQNRALFDASQHTGFLIARRQTPEAMSYAQFSAIEEDRWQPQARFDGTTRGCMSMLSMLTYLPWPSASLPGPLPKREGRDGRPVYVMRQRRHPRSV